jgi:hypothetical protein
MIADNEEEVPLHKPFEGVTVTEPMAVDGTTVMELVPCPAVIVHPEGTTHV